MLGMDETTFANVVMKKAAQARTLCVIDKKGKSSKSVVVDPSILFNLGLASSEIVVID